MRRFPTLAALFAITAIGSAEPALQKVADGFTRPVWVNTPPDEARHLWVVEQEGKIWIVDQETGKRRDEPFLDISEQVSRKGNEEGLLGLAFAPDFPESGRFYLNFTDNDQTTRIVRYRTGADRFTADPKSAEVLMEIPQPYRNHNGGWLDFGPDGFLYIGNGDGGSGNDPENAGQRLDTHLGKILRIDVSPEKGYTIPADNPFKDSDHPEIWAYGVRNPWRCSFDRENGDFWMGDVGQNAREEINFMAAGKGAGANYGWRLREGFIATPTGNVGGAAPAEAVEPVYDYERGGGSDEGMSVTGGYVYRGPVEELRGLYLFADYANPRIWSLKPDGNGGFDFQDHTDQLRPERGRLGPIASFGEDSKGNVYVVDHNGPIYRIVSR